jgi:hypothetical protein
MYVKQFCVLRLRGLAQPKTVTGAELKWAPILWAFSETLAHCCALPTSALCLVVV